MSNKLQSVQKKGFREFPEFSENPFISSIVVQQRNQTVAISKKPLNIVDRETGEEQETAFFHIRKRRRNEDSNNRSMQNQKLQRKRDALPYRDLEY